MNLTEASLGARKMHHYTNKWGANFVSHFDIVKNQLLYTITFRNSMRIQGVDIDSLIQKAEVYAEGIKRLTGEYP